VIDGIVPGCPGVPQPYLGDPVPEPYPEFPTPEPEVPAPEPLGETPDNRPGVEKKGLVAEEAEGGPEPEEGLEEGPGEEPEEEPEEGGKAKGTPVVGRKRLDLEGPLADGLSKKQIRKKNLKFYKFRQKFKGGQEDESVAGFTKKGGGQGGQGGGQGGGGQNEITIDKYSVD
jgi:hypothetical protein